VGLCTHLRSRPQAVAVRHPFPITAPMAVVLPAVITTIIPATAVVAAVALDPLLPVPVLAVVVALVVAAVGIGSEISVRA
jgi:hypothetical protein